MSLATRAAQAAIRQRLWGALLRAEEEYPKLAAPDGTVAVKIDDLRAAIGCTISAERLACEFHERYERLAPQFGYETRGASAKPWTEVPENNRRLMTATCDEILTVFFPHSRAGPEYDPGSEGCVTCGGAAKTAHRPTFVSCNQENSMSKNMVERVARLRSTLPAVVLVAIMGGIYAAGVHTVAAIGLGVLTLGYAIEADISRKP